VPANFPFGVLANDTDDVDVRNEGLRLSGIASEPVYADEFILLADGSFRYTAKDNLELGDAAFLDDVITVRISDGIHQVDSTITVRLVEENRAPTLQSRIPNFIALIADDQTIDVAIDFSSYFADKDGNTLRYSITDVPAITSGNLVFSENGQLRGTLSTNDFSSDLITLTAFDGLETASDRFRLTVRSDRSAEGSFFSSAELTVKLHE